MSRRFSLVALILALLIPLAPSWAQNRIGMLEIEGKVRGRPGEFDWLASKPSPTLRDLVQLIEGSASRGDIDVLVIRLKDAELDRTQIEELGEAMARARKTGRTIHLFAEHYTPAEILLGTYADSTIIQTGGAVAFPGLYMEELYLAETLAWLGVKADFVQVGDYKGASETMSNRAPSPEWEENISQLLDSMYQIMRRDVKQGREMSDDELDRAMKAVWMGTAEQGIKAGLIDAQVDLPALGKHLAKRDDPKFVQLEAAAAKNTQMDSSNPFAAISAMMEMFTKTPRQKPTKPTIAVLHVDGPIVDGDSTAGGLFGSASVGSRTIRNAMEEIRGEDQIKAVILRIDSPGGSATASEVMWQGVRRLAEKKPVWVSIGSMAASGGYYVAVAGDRIYVNPSSIVGSIGVVGGKMSLGGLYDKIGINVVGRGRGPMSGMFASAEVWNDEQRALIRAKMSDIYELFTSRVSQGRKGIDLSRTAEGRLFTGVNAIDLNMADRIGGLDTAIDDLASHVKLAEFDVLHYPGPRGLDELLEDMFSGFGASARTPRGRLLAAELVAGLGQAIGPRHWPAIAAQLEAMSQLRRQPAVLVSPRAIIFR
jgi:protease IV